MNTVIRVGLMCRVSTEEQAVHGDSMQAQEDSLVAYANENNMKIVNIYRDGGFSARKPILKRPAMLELLEDVKAGKLDMILFTKLDRWFRNLEQYYAVQKILDKHGVVWKAIMEEYNTATADGRLKVNIMLSVAENEADRTSERIRFVFNSKIMRKEVIFSSQNAPMGYKVIKIDGVRKLVKDDETREMTEYFFNIALTSSIRNAVIMIEQKYGIHKDYKAWHKMAHNEIYIGKYRGVEDFCEPYLTQAQFNELNNGRIIRKPKGNRVYMFTGMIRCPICGRVMVSKFCKNRYKEYYYYRCPLTLTRACPQKYLSEEKVEKYVLENVVANLEKFIFSHEIAQPTPPKKKTDSAKLKEQLRRVNVSYQLGNMEDAEYIAETKELKAKIEKATKEETHDTTVDIEALKEFLNSGFDKIYDSLEKADKQRLWRSVIDEIYFDGENLTGFKFKA